MKRMGKFVLIIIGFTIFSFGTIFFSPQNANASAGDIVITEIMYNPDGTNDKHQWVEIYNASTDEVEITGWKFNDGDGPTNHILNIPDGETGIWVASGEYLILADNKETFLADYPGFIDQVIDTVVNLKTSSATISLIDKTGLKVDELTYDSSWGGYNNNRTLEKIEPQGTNDQSNWQESYALGGTPGQPNSKFTLPNYPDEVFELVNFEQALLYSAEVTSIVDGDTLEVSGLSNFPSTIRLLAMDSPETGHPLFEPAKDFTGQLVGQTVDLIISQNPDEQLDIYNRTLAVVIFQDQVFNSQLMERGLASYFATDNSLIIQETWQAIEVEARNERIGLWASASGESAILSEMLPNPVGLDSAGEWIELYNPWDSTINLSYFKLEQYLIPFGTTISSGSWLIFPGSETGITLNNSGDIIRLYFPDGQLADEISYSKASEGFSWAWTGESWQWTSTPTPNHLNIITGEELDDAGGDEESDEPNVPINSEPIEIKTGDYKTWENYLVKVTGEVVETSGNTFWLDDGSGKVKIYIQAATGIEKPEMHKGDIFQVIGVVNIYRDTWRILPQNQDDIKLVKAADEDGTSDAKTASSTAKKSTSTAAKKSTSSATKTGSSSLAPKKVSAAEDSTSNANIQVQGSRSPFWVQFMESFTGLSLILLIVLIVKVLRIKREQPIGGHFGDDYT